MSESEYELLKMALIRRADLLYENHVQFGWACLRRCRSARRPDEPSTCKASRRCNFSRRRPSRQSASPSPSA